MSTGIDEENDENYEEEDVVEEEEEEEEKMQNENEIGFPTGNISTIYSNEVNNNDLGTNDIVIDEITTVSGPTEAHTFWEKREGRTKSRKF